MKKSLLAILLLLNLTGCMLPDDQTNEREEVEVSRMMDSQTLNVDTSRKLFTTTAKYWKGVLNVKIDPIGIFGYIIQESDLMIEAGGYPVKKNSNESFQITLPKNFEDEELEIKVYMSSDQPIFLNKKRYDSPAVVLLKKQVVAW